MDPNFGKFGNQPMNNYPRNPGFGFDQTPSQGAMNQVPPYGGHQIPQGHQMAGGFNQQPTLGFGGLDMQPQVPNQYNNSSAPFSNYQQSQPGFNQGHNMNPYPNAGFNNNYQAAPNAQYQNFQNPNPPMSNAYQNNQYYPPQQHQMPPQQPPQHFNQYQGHYNQQYNAGNK